MIRYIVLYALTYVIPLGIGTLIWDQGPQYHDAAIVVAFMLTLICLGWFSTKVGGRRR